MDSPSICRDCLTPFSGPGRCPACRTPRALTHPELNDLSIAHLDCDAFYAAVEKRDDPSLHGKPLIIGGGRRGVVSTCCYVARIRGVRSAMPMFKALKLCPEAVILKPRMSLYVEVSRSIREMMLALTPAVEPLSLDEAFLDLTGTTRLTGLSPAAQMLLLQTRIEREIGITVSVGLSHNKFLAKIASDLDKPRGFAIIGRAETAAFLARQPVGLIWGVGGTTLAALESEGIRTIADLRTRDRKALIRRFGTLGDRLWSLARGDDSRAVQPSRAAKSISNETTFNEDIADPAALNRILWTLSEKVSARAKSAGTGGLTVTLKLKRTDHSVLTRRRTLAAPTQMADRIYRTGEPLLRRNMDAGPFRLIGIGLGALVPAADCDPEGDLLDPSGARRLTAERAADAVRARFGSKSIALGRSLD